MPCESQSYMQFSVEEDKTLRGAGNCPTSRLAFAPAPTAGPKQLNLFEKLPADVAEKEWFRDHIKNPPPVNVQEQAKQRARQRISEALKININKNNLQ